DEACLIIGRASCHFDEKKQRLARRVKESPMRGLLSLSSHREAVEIKMLVTNKTLFLGCSDKSCHDSIVAMGTIDDARIRGRNYCYDVAINADCGMDGLANSLIYVLLGERFAGLNCQLDKLDQSVSQQNGPSCGQTYCKNNNCHRPEWLTDLA